jgi:diguanylate cyclase
MSTDANRTKILSSIGVKLTVLAEGESAGLNKALGKLRDSLRKNADITELEQLSNLIMKQAMAEEEKAANDELGIDAFFSKLSAHVKSLKPADDAIKQNLSALAKDLGGSKSLELRLAALQETFAVIAKMRRAGGNAPAKSKGVSGWLGFKGAEEKDEAWVGEFFAAVVSLLDKVLDHLEVLNEDKSNILRLKDQVKDLESLETNQRVDEVESILQGVLALLDDITKQVSSERIATQSFLGDIKGKLQFIENAVSSVNESSDGFLQRAVTLGDEINRDVGEIGRVVNESDNLSVLRSSVETRVNSVCDNLANYLEKEEKFNASYKQEIEQLTRKVVEMEHQADGLRASIHERHQLAVKDPLTGVYNRAGHDEKIADEFARFQRSGLHLSIIFVDCNKFKIINDTFGHKAGDVVLMQVAKALQARARVSDAVCRFGGDEFVVILPDTKIDGAEIYARDVAKRIEQAGFNSDGVPLDVSISCGVTQFKAGDTPQTALERADAAMYEAKKLAKEKVVVAP